MNAVRMHRFGDPSVLRYERCPDPKPACDEVLVAVEAVGVNHLDLDVRAGTSRWPVHLPHIPGTEFAGRVVAAGRDVPASMLGTRVMAFEAVCGACEYCRTGRDNLCNAAGHFGLTIPGGYAQFVRAPLAGVLPLDERIASATAAVAQLGFGTAWHMLVTRGQLAAGETVLVNAAASSVGVAALQIARWRGARILASAGSPEKLAYARSLGVDALIDYSREDIAEAVLALTDGRGVDLVFEHVGGPLFERILGCVARDGRIVTCGAHAGEVVSLDIIPFFRRQISLIGCRRVSSRELREVLALLADGTFEPVIHATLPLEAAAEAHTLLERRANVGKLVLIP